MTRTAADRRRPTPDRFSPLGPSESEIRAWLRQHEPAPNDIFAAWSAAADALPPVAPLGGRDEAARRARGLRRMAWLRTAMAVLVSDAAQAPIPRH
jgi:hypothetical protein